tara:strand:+ start:570 stop:728 length:159 start_codon:yes stop_codon:yes gene_type:complete
MKEKVAKKLETNVAELIMIAMVILVLLSSCGSTQNTCAAYANVDCENCDEID